MHAQFCHTKSNAIVTLPHASHIAALLGFDMIVRCLQRPPLWFSDGGRRFDSGRSGSLSEKGEKRKRLAVDRNVGTPKRSPGGQNYPGALHYCARYSVPRFTKRMRRIKVPEHFSKKKNDRSCENFGTAGARTQAVRARNHDSAKAREAVTALEASQ